MDLYTIGFTKKTAEEFFSILRTNSIELVVDVRLHPDGQLAGFSKKVDLAYFLHNLNQCGYIHLPQLAPTEEILHRYRAKNDWQAYQFAFLSLLDERNIPTSLDRTIFEAKRCCLLCSEATADKCHRRLVAEQLQINWGNVQIYHI
jgi:uncharacterized protein (DUF488 family)